MDWLNSLQASNPTLSLQEGPFFYLACILVFVLGFVVWIAYIRHQSRKQLRQLEKEIRKIERDFVHVRDRSRSNIQIARQVLDGFDDMIQKMRCTLEEEEKKIDAMPVDKISHEEEKNPQTHLPEEIKETQGQIHADKPDA